MEKSTLKDEKEEDSAIITTENQLIQSRLGKKHELAPVSRFLEERGTYLLPINLEKNPTTGLTEIKTLYETGEFENVIDIEVFKNYMAILVEKDGQR